MNVQFSTINKRINSTKQSSGGAAYDCILKDASGIERPRIILKWQGAGAPRWNYAYIPEYGRYYWVNDWTFIDRCWEASLEVDVLASYKDQIGAAEKYILRSASEFDPNVADTTYPIIMEPYITNRMVEGSVTSWGGWLSEGRYIVGIVGESNDFSGAGIGYVVADGAAVQQLISKCFTETGNTWEQATIADTIGEGFRKFGELLSKSVFVPGQFINSIIWVPYQPSVGNRNHVFLCAVDTNMLIPKLASEKSVFFITIPANIIQPGADEGLWRYMEPFARYELVFPPFGRFPLDAGKLYDAGDTGTVTVDNITGEAFLNLPHFGITASAQVGVKVQLAGSNIDVTGAVSNAIGTIGAVSGGNVLGTLAGVGSVISALAPNANGGGVGGGLSALSTKPYIHITRYPAPEEDMNERGRPLCKVKQLSSLTGYILCADGDIEAPATAAELSQIASFLTGGFFYE